MQDSDDEYFSDFTLDDKTLAILDEQESKFGRNTGTQGTLRSDASPPPKRQKTRTPWAPATTARLQSIERGASTDDMDDLPDIAIQTDGSYALRDKPQRTSRLLRLPAPAPLQSTSTRGTEPLARTSATLSARLLQPVTPVPVPRIASLCSRRPPPSRTDWSAAVLSQGTAGSRPGLPPYVGGSTSAPAQTLGPYRDELLRQVEELRDMNRQMETALQRSQADLQAATNAKFAKDGEVTILRKGMEKTARDHAAQIAKLKATKEEEDTKQLMLKKQFEAEIERIKTESAFKQHELEIALRKPPGSVRSKKTGMGPPLTLVSTPAQMRTWRQGSDVPASSQPVPETPRRPRFGEMTRLERPRMSMPADNRNLPSGFQISTPVRSQREWGGKGKGKAFDPVGTPVLSSMVPDHLSHPALPLPTQPVQEASVIPNRSGQEDVFIADGTSDTFAPIDVDALNDVEMEGEGENLALTPVEEESEQWDPPNWNFILHRVILLHHTKDLTISTLQLLMTVSITDQDQAQGYRDALSVVIGVLATIPNYPTRDFDQTTRTVCGALCNMASQLMASSIIPPLAALLDLLSSLAHTIPSFYGPLFSSKVSEQDDTPKLLCILCTIVKDKLHRLDSLKEGETLDLCALGKATLSLLETIARCVPEDIETVLAHIPRSPSILALLLQPCRPQWFLLYSVRCLVWLSTRRGLCHSLLSSSDIGIQDGDDQLPQQTYLSHVDLLCALLTDPDRTSPKGDEMKTWITMFFGMLSITHSDAFTVLAESQVLLPSLIIRVCHLAERVWEAEELQDGDASLISKWTTMIVQTIRFLHHLVMAGDLNLRERLHRAPMRKFSGLIHSFIETFGRLSYADCPDCISSADKLTWEKVADMARLLLGLVVEGPEADLIWGTYQYQPDDSGNGKMDTDDEDIVQVLDD